MLSQQRYRTLLIICVVLGTLVGLFGAAFATIWHALDDWIWATGTIGPADRIWISALAGLIIGLILKAWCDPGNMSTIVRRFHATGRLDHADNKPILPTSLLGLVAGQSAGPEGVLTQICGSMGTWLADRFRNPSFARILTLAGMGAGFGAFLGAPVGGSLLWLEMLHRRGLEYYEALIPTILTSFVGFLVMAVILNNPITPMWSPSAILPDSGMHLVIALGIGVLGAAAAYFYAALFRSVGKVARRFPMPIYIRTTLAGLIIGLCGWAFPLSYFYGAREMDHVLHNTMPVLLILGTLIAKMLAASVTINGHWQGGLIIPHLFMGALIGKAVAMLIPGVDPTLAMLTGMVAFNAAATQTPLSSALIVLTLTGLGHTIPIFLASLTGYLVGYRVELIQYKQPRSEMPEFHLPMATTLAPADAK